MEKIKSALRRLDLSENEQLIYLSLLSEGAATARTLSVRTGITRPSVYDQLKLLRDRNLVVELDIDGKTQFAAGDIKQLDALLEDKIDRLTQSRDFLADTLPSLMTSLEAVQPKIRFFEGEENVKQLFKDILWHDELLLKIIWPHDSMSELFDEKFLQWFDERRKLRKTAIHSIWPTHSTKVQMSLLTNYTGDIAKRLPKSTPMSPMASLIYKNKVALISSNAESFGFVVESKEFFTLQELQFEVLWRTSKA